MFLSPMPRPHWALVRILKSLQMSLGRGLVRQRAGKTQQDCLICLFPVGVSAQPCDALEVSVPLRCHFLFQGQLSLEDHTLDGNKNNTNLFIHNIKAKWVEAEAGASRDWLGRMALFPSQMKRCRLSFTSLYCLTL